MANVIQLIELIKASLSQKLTTTGGVNSLTEDADVESINDKMVGPTAKALVKKMEINREADIPTTAKETSSCRCRRCNKKFYRKHAVSKSHCGKIYSISIGTQSSPKSRT